MPQQSRLSRFTAASGRMSRMHPAQYPPHGSSRLPGEAEVYLHGEVGECSEAWQEPCSHYHSLQLHPSPFVSPEPGSVQDRSAVPHPGTRDPYDQQSCPSAAECSSSRDPLLGPSQKNSFSSGFSPSPKVQPVPPDSARTRFLSPTAWGSPQRPPSAAPASAPCQDSGPSLGGASASSPLLSRLLLSILTSPSDTTRVAALLHLEAHAVELLPDTRRLHMTLTVLDVVLCNAVPIAVVALGPHISEPSMARVPRQPRDYPAGPPFSTFPDILHGGKAHAEVSKQAGASGTAAPTYNGPHGQPLSSGNTEGQRLSRTPGDSEKSFAPQAKERRDPSDTVFGADADHSLQKLPGASQAAAPSRGGPAGGRRSSRSSGRGSVSFQDACDDVELQNNVPPAFFASPTGPAAGSHTQVGAAGLSLEADARTAFACAPGGRASVDARHLGKRLDVSPTDELSSVVQIDLITDSHFFSEGAPGDSLVETQEPVGDDAEPVRHVTLDAEARLAARSRASVFSARRTGAADLSAEREAWRRGLSSESENRDAEDGEDSEGRGCEAPASALRVRGPVAKTGRPAATRMTSPVRSSHGDNGRFSTEETRHHRHLSPSCYPLGPATGDSATRGGQLETQTDSLSRQKDTRRNGVHTPQPVAEPHASTSSGARQRERLLRSFENVTPPVSSLRGAGDSRAKGPSQWPRKQTNEGAERQRESLPAFCPRPSVVVGQPFTAVARLVCMQVYTSVCVCLDLVLICPEWVERLVGLLHSILRRTSVHEDAVFRSYACDCLQELERNCPGLLSTFLGPDWFAGPGLVSTLSTATLDRLACQKKANASLFSASQAAESRAPFYLLDLLQTERQHVAEAYAGLLVTAARHTTEMLVQETIEGLLETRRDAGCSTAAEAPNALQAPHAANVAHASRPTDMCTRERSPGGLRMSDRETDSEFPSSGRGREGNREVSHANLSPSLAEAHLRMQQHSSRYSPTSLRDQLWEPRPALARSERQRASNSRDRTRRRDASFRVDHSDPCFRIPPVGVSLVPLLPLEFPSSLGTRPSTFSVSEESEVLSLSAGPQRAFSATIHNPRDACLSAASSNAFGSPGHAFSSRLSGHDAVLCGRSSSSHHCSFGTPFDFPPPRLPRRFVTSLLRALAVVLDGFWWFGEWMQLHVVRNLVFFSRLLGLPPAVTVDPLLPLLYSDRPPLVHAFLRLVAEYPHTVNNVVVQLVHQKVKDLATNSSLKLHFRVLALRWLVALFDLPLLAPLFFRSPPAFLYPSAGDSTEVKEQLLQLLLIYYHRRGRYLSRALQSASAPLVSAEQSERFLPLSTQALLPPSSPASLPQTSCASRLSSGQPDSRVDGSEADRFEDVFPSSNPLFCLPSSRTRLALSRLDSNYKPDTPHSSAGGFEFCGPPVTAHWPPQGASRSGCTYTPGVEAAVFVVGLPENLLDVCEVLQEFRYSTGPVGAHAVVYRFLLRLLQFPGQPLREKVHAFICEQLRSQPAMLMTSTLALLHHLSNCRSAPVSPPPQELLDFSGSECWWRRAVESHAAVAYSLLLSLGDFVKRLEPPSHIPQFFPLLLRLAIEPVVQPHIVLRALHRLVDVSAKAPRTAPADDRHQWEVGMKILAICRQVLITHSQAALYEGLSRLLLELAEATPCIDLRDNAILLLKVFAHASQRPLKSLLTRGDHQLLPLMRRHLTCVFPCTYRVEGPLPFLTLEKSRRERREMCGLSDHQAAFFLSTAFSSAGEEDPMADVFACFDKTRGTPSWHVLEGFASSFSSEERRSNPGGRRGSSLSRETAAMQSTGGGAEVGGEDQLTAYERLCFSAFEKFYASCYESDDKTIALLNTMHAHSAHHTQGRMWRRAASAAADAFPQLGRNAICASSPLIVPPASTCKDGLSSSPHPRADMSLLSPSKAPPSACPSSHTHLCPSPSLSTFPGATLMAVNRYRAFVAGTPFFIRIPFCLRFKAKRNFSRVPPVRPSDLSASPASPKETLRSANASVGTSSKHDAPRGAAVRARNDQRANRGVRGSRGEVYLHPEDGGLLDERAASSAHRNCARDSKRAAEGSDISSRHVPPPVEGRRADRKGFLDDEEGKLTPGAGPCVHGKQTRHTTVDSVGDLPLLTELYGIELIFSHAEDYAPMRSVRLPFLQDGSLLSHAGGSEGPWGLEEEDESDADEENGHVFPFMYKLVLKLQPQQPVPASVAVDVRFNDATGSLFFGQLETFSVSFQDLFLPVCAPSSFWAPLFQHLWADSSLHRSVKILEFDRSTVQDMIDMTLRPFLVEEPFSDDSEDFDFEQDEYFIKPDFQAATRDCSQTRNLSRRHNGSHRSCISRQKKLHKIAKLTSPRPHRGIEGRRQRVPAAHSSSEASQSSDVDSDSNPRCGSNRSDMRYSATSTDSDENCMVEEIYPQEASDISSDSSFFVDEYFSQPDSSEGSDCQSGKSSQNGSRLRSSLDPNLLVFRVIIFMPPRYHLLLKFSVSRITTVVRVATDRYQLLGYMDNFFEASSRLVEAKSRRTGVSNCRQVNA
ncbi:hypothetical protein TGCAST_320550 [Toxoplasma gondii CAST]|uniref:AP5B1 C-terminal domain-containing protein n=1 Tax=Toxoplasma gondii CAST TaxID=943122 RepID=A0A425HNQ7_TOXGO|nr:hypothetical protein TGCAST_320550 [Toxoplasma gondii CAST]